MPTIHSPKVESICWNSHHNPPLSIWKMCGGHWHTHTLNQERGSGSIVSCWLASWVWKSGSWGVRQLGSWGVRELGSREVGELGSWEVGELGSPEVRELESWGVHSTIRVFFMVISITGHCTIHCNYHWVQPDMYTASTQFSKKSEKLVLMPQSHGSCMGLEAMGSLHTKNMNILCIN